MSDASYDVIVVGAGLSGLVCARRLHEAGKSVLVLEARDRVGGRLHSVPFAGTTIDLGGQWMSVGQPRLAALATELGIRSFPQRRDGTPLFALDGDPRNLAIRIASAISRWRAARTVERLARNPPTDRSADTSLADWLATNIRNRSAADLLAMHAELVFATDPASLSLFHYLDIFARTGGFSPRGPDLPGGGREHRFLGGAQALALALAARVTAADPRCIRLASPVRAIVDDKVHTDDAVFAARRIVLALPPALMNRIDFTPALPAAIPASTLGPVVKCFAAYERPFWRDDNLSGEAFRPTGDIRATVALEPPPAAVSTSLSNSAPSTSLSNSAPSTSSSNGAPSTASSNGAPSILLAFVVGNAAKDWHARDVEDRRDLVLATLIEQFGEAAATPLDYLEADWSLDPWSTGCVAALAPNTFSPPSTWRAPHGRIHFAGTESADAWPGYMEGAIESGERAATELLPLLTA